GPEQWLEWRIILHAANDGPVLRRDIVQIVGGNDPAGAGHVADDHLRRAGNVPAEMAGDHPCQRVVAAACRRADDQRHGLAAIEFGGRLGPCGTHRQPDADERKGQKAERNGHDCLRRITRSYRSPEKAERNPGIRASGTRSAGVSCAPLSGARAISARAPTPPTAGEPRYW